MKSKSKIGIVVVALLIAAVFSGCSDPPEVVARNVIAAAKGVIEQQQSAFAGECIASPTDQPCVLINKAVALQNAAIDSLEVYCGSAEFEAGGACTPHSSAEPKLREAVKQLDDLIKQLKVLIPESSSRTPVATSQVSHEGHEVRTKAAARVELAGLADGSLLGTIELVLMILGPLVGAFRKNPAYAAVVAGLQAAIQSLEKVKEEIITRVELEALRTRPKW